MGRAPCCQDQETHALKKGAWTAEEDEKLVSFIDRNKGHGSWRTLPRLAGLQRCGKSCRLRWTNYLRPNIKRGSFTADEEWVIIRLHALLGNKWSNIASHLPGRTDNEVKNHWNTHLKKRLSRLGIDPMTHLPITHMLLHLRSCNNLNLQPVNMQHAHNNNNQQPSKNLSPLVNSPTSWKPLPYVPCLDQSFVSHMAQWELSRLQAEARLPPTSSGLPPCPHTTYQTPCCSSSSSDNHPAASHPYIFLSTLRSDHSQISSFSNVVPDLALPASVTNPLDRNSMQNSALIQDHLPPSLYSCSRSTEHIELNYDDPCQVASSELEAGTLLDSTDSAVMASGSSASANSFDISTRANYWAHMLSLVDPIVKSC